MRIQPGWIYVFHRFYLFYSQKLNFYFESDLFFIKFLIYFYILCENTLNKMVFCSYEGKRVTIMFFTMIGLVGTVVCFFFIPQMLKSEVIKHNSTKVSFSYLFFSIILIFFFHQFRKLYFHFWSLICSFFCVVFSVL